MSLLFRSTAVLFGALITLLLPCPTAAKPSYGDAHSNLGVLFHTGGQLELAIEAYRTALALAPAHPNAGQNLAMALRAVG